MSSGILLIDSSSKKIEFGYARMSGIIFKEELDSGNNADTLTYFIKTSFEKNKISFTDIEFVSLSNGPGSFTGLRIGSAIAKGICFSTGSRLIEISTLDVIANKFKSSEKKIIPLIFSNSRTLEFYFSEYRLDERLIRLSDYQIGLMKDIVKDDSDYIVNETINSDIPEEFREKLIDVSGTSNINSLYELSVSNIEQNKFSEYENSEPFYMKEFVPKGQ